MCVCPAQSAGLAKALEENVAAKTRSDSCSHEPEQPTEPLLNPAKPRRSTILEAYVDYLYDGNLEQERFSSAVEELKGLLKNSAMNVSNEHASTALKRTVITSDRKQWGKDLRSIELDPNVIVLLLAHHVSAQCSLCLEGEASVHFEPQGKHHDSKMSIQFKSFQGFWTCKKVSMPAALHRYIHTYILAL